MAGKSDSLAVRAAAMEAYEAPLDLFERLAAGFREAGVDDITDFDNEDCLEDSFLISLNPGKIRLQSEELDALLETQDAYFFNVMISQEKPLVMGLFWKYPRRSGGRELILSWAPFLEEQIWVLDAYQEFAKANGLCIVTKEDWKEPVLLDGDRLGLYTRFFNRSADALREMEAIMQEPGRWDLGPLYSSLEDPRIEEDLTGLTRLVEESQSLLTLETDGADQMVQAMGLAEQVIDTLRPLASYFSLLSSADTSQGKPLALLNQVKGIMSGFAGFEVRLKRMAAKLPTEELVAMDSLKAYDFFLRQSKKEAAHLLDPELEELIARLDIYGAGAWGNLFRQLTSTAAKEVDGKQKTLTEIRNLAYSPDPRVRRQAYQAELALYPEIEKPLAGALGAIKGQVVYLSRRRGHQSPLDEALFKSKMDRKTLDAMIDAMVEGKGVFIRYFKAKAAWLGQERLHWADLFAPIGQLPDGYSVEDSRSMLVQSFEKLHPPIAQLIDKAYRDRWIDFHPRANKVGGAFCANLTQIRQSRVLTNFDGSFSGVSTLAHELGHAYHGFRIEGHAPLNRSYSMPVAETASIFNETHFLLEQVGATSDRLVKLGLLDGFLMNSGQVICDILSRFLFEQEVFERVERETLKSEDLQAIMHKAQLAAYGDGLDEASLHPYMWACKPHYYSASLSYYNFPYAFGALFASALYRKATEEGSSFMARYDQMLTATTVSSVEETGRLVGLDLTDKVVWLESMDSFEPFVSTFEALVQEAGPAL